MLVTKVYRKNNGTTVRITQNGHLPSQNSMLTVRYANRHVEVPIMHDVHGDFVELGQKEQRILRCPPVGLHAKVDADNVWHVGPAIGVYALRHGTNGALFGPQTKMFATLIQLGRRLGIDVFILPAGHLGRDQTEVLAYRLYKSGGWRKMRCPWPDFVWRRMTERPAAMANVLDEEENLLSKTSIQGVLPRNRCDKWTLHSELTQDDLIANYVPDTVLVTEVDQVLPAVDSFGDVYIKPVRGTQGMKIARIVQQGSGYLYQDRGSPQSFEWIKNGRELLNRWGQPLSPQQGYLIQKTVPLMMTRFKDPFDLRYLIQAVPEKTAACTAIVARLARSQALTTNLHTGSRAVTIETVKELLALKDSKRFVKGVQMGEIIAMLAFQVLQQKYSSLIELGVDIALDSLGRPFLLEVNPVPGRKMLRLLDPKLRRLSFLRVLEYAVWSTGF